MPFDNTKAAEIELTLHAAADYIERNGWCQRSFRHGDRRCVAGAIKEVAGVYATPLLYLQARLGVQSITGWNDEPGRTTEEVLRALRGV